MYDATGCANGLKSAIVPPLPLVFTRCGDGAPGVISDLAGRHDHASERQDRLILGDLDGRAAERVVEFVEADVVPESANRSLGARSAGPQLGQGGHALGQKQAAFRLPVRALQLADDGVAADGVELQLLSHDGEFGSVGRDRCEVCAGELKRMSRSLRRPATSCTFSICAFVGPPP